MALYDCTDGLEEDRETLAQKDFAGAVAGRPPARRRSTGHCSGVTVRRQAVLRCPRAYAVETDKAIAATTECGALVAGESAEECARPEESETIAASPSSTKVVRAAALALAVPVAAGCAAQSGPDRKGRRRRAVERCRDLSSVSSVVVDHAGREGREGHGHFRAQDGPYTASALAIGEEKDLAQRRADGIGFVRAASLEQCTRRARGRSCCAGSGVTGVPGA